jgi:hypothetical protein
MVNYAYTIRDKVGENIKVMKQFENNSAEQALLGDFSKASGDILGQPMLAHKAVHEAHVAAEVIAGELQGNKELAAAAFNARVIPSVAYTDPEVAWVGLT